MISTYKQFMAIGFNGDVTDPLRKIADEMIFGFGTAVDEKCKGIKGLLNLLSIQKEQSKGLGISWRIKPVWHYTTADENTAVFADDVYLSIKTGEEVVKMYLRFSMVLSFSDNQWKVIHWHGSKPENVESEKDTWGLETWKEKAEALEKEVAERTADLVKKNRELEIETSLERVRAVAMSMRKPEDLLDIVEVLFRELQTLGFRELRNTNINIHDDDKRSFLNYDYSAKGKSITPFSYDAHPVIKKLVKKVRSNPDAFTTSFLKGKELTDFKNFREKNGEKTDAQLKKADAIYYYFHSTGTGAIGISNLKPASPEQIEILKRFRNVFGLAYKRYEDITKAEAQAREAQIEAALEKVRASMMAMHQSEELPTVMTVIADQMIQLGIRIDAVTFMPVSSEKDLNFWSATTAKTYPVRITVPYINHPLFNIIHEGIIKGIDFTTFLLSEEDVQRWWKQFYEQSNVGPSVAPERKAYIESTGGYASSMAFRKYSTLNIVNYAGIPFSEEENSILIRFANVFEQSYTRFLDLQKAEAQAREAQIEAALEKVRSRSLAMHKSEELIEVVNAVFERFTELGIEHDTAIINTTSEGTLETTLWIATKGQKYANSIFLPYIDHSITKDIWSAYEAGEEALCKRYSFEEKNEWFKIAFEVSGFKYIPEERKNYLLGVKDYAISIVFGKNLSMQVISFSGHILELSELEVLKRFTKVFDQAYTRFLDLQKAEAQAREAQIEASLERVRSKTMAMHSSKDVGESVAALFDELTTLGVLTAIDRCGIGIMQPNEKMEVWTAEKTETTELTIGLLDMKQHPLLKSVYQNWSDKRETFQYILEGEDKTNYYEAIRNQADYEIRKDYFSAYEKIVHTDFFFKEGCLYVFSHNEFTKEASSIFIRFVNVFGQTYTRFLDLQKAEAQAREAQIEASLERVRAKAMAMHSSKDLAETIHAFYSELVSMNLTPRRCGLGLINKETHEAELSSMNTTEDGVSVEVIGKFVLADHPVLEGIYNHWLEQKEYHPVLRGNEIKEYYQLLRKQMAFPDYPSDAVQYGYFFYFEEGGVYAWTEKPLEEDELKIYRRFTSVLSLTYKRYKDLKDAEARAKEAVRQASLDRVRAEIASMRTVNDLDRITPLIWRELTTLGIPFVRCGVFIMDESEEQIQTYLSTPDGRAIAAFKLPYESTDSLAEAVANWRERKMYATHWVERDFYTQADTLLQQGAITSREQYLNTIPKEGIHLHFLPFLQGMLYVGNTSPLKRDDLQLVQSLADAFSTAYARYEDFNKLEAAKKQVENTLSDLKQAQQQLVQSEKMASLGELTAGIAHEIQNPLNFVNNFSEVSNELMDELIKELAVGSKQSADELMTDIKQNLEKINFHGKRAGDIVKSMLQHSRKSTGQKELTDINVLCDEYLRLAYHGLRAKDKSFNAKFEMDFDPALPKLNVVPQDIGRVILNLITNAFYAVNARANNYQPTTTNKPYTPTVTVSTKKAGDTIEISVSDNGPGIPDSIKEKIFQPFFTTKPTGQGTGLGLSLSYDIVKAHGGEIKVETQVDEGNPDSFGKGEGTAFIVLLPK